MRVLSPIRGFSLTVDIVAPLLAIISYVARKRQVPLYSAAITIELTGDGEKSLKYTLLKRALCRICAFREQRACVFARHWVIFVRGR